VLHRRAPSAIHKRTAQRRSLGTRIQRLEEKIAKLSSRQGDAGELKALEAQWLALQQELEQRNAT